MHRRDAGRTNRVIGTLLILAGLAPFILNLVWPAFRIGRGAGAVVFTIVSGAFLIHFGEDV